MLPAGTVPPIPVSYQVSDEEPPAYPSPISETLRHCVLGCGAFSLPGVPWEISDCTIPAPFLALNPSIPPPVFLFFLPLFLSVLSSFLHPPPFFLRRDLPLVQVALGLVISTSASPGWDDRLAPLLLALVLFISVSGQLLRMS